MKFPKEPCHRHLDIELILRTAHEWNTDLMRRYRNDNVPHNSGMKSHEQAMNSGT